MNPPSSTVAGAGATSLPVAVAVSVSVPTSISSSTNTSGVAASTIQKAVSNVNQPTSSATPAATSSNAAQLSISKAKKKRVFTRELKHMMYGFGDVKHPLPESVELMEDLVNEYVTEMTRKATEISSKRGKLQTEDLVFLIRKDRKKYTRVKELLVMHEELKNARKAFELENE